MADSLHLRAFLLVLLTTGLFAGRSAAQDPRWSQGPAGQRPTIENQTVRVEFDPSRASFDMYDLRTGRCWRQGSPAGRAEASSAERADDGRSISAELRTAAGAVRLVIEVREPAEVLVRLAPVGTAPASPLLYPPHVMPAETAELVLPADEGILLPAAAVAFRYALGDYEYRQGGLLMPWVGLMDGQQGIMALVETPDDMHVRVVRVAPEGAGGPGRLLSWGVVWLPSRGRLGYERRVRFCLFDRGGYVAMAKRYRKSLVDAGRFRTLADKAKELPAVARLIGAIDIHDVTPLSAVHDSQADKASGSDVLEWMIASGIRRALYYGPADKARNQRAAAAGYVAARYYDDLDLPPPEFARSEEGRIAARRQIAEQGIIRPDGSILPGWPRPVGVRGGVLAPGQELRTIQGGRRCSAVQLAVVQDHAPGDAARYALGAEFLDVETALALNECYSPRHPLSRSEDRRLRTALFDYLRSIGQIAGSEGGADWPAAALHFQEGSLTLNRFASLPGVYFGTGLTDLSAQYAAVQFDVARRVPLAKLVYHDSVLMTWRWNHTPNRWVKGAEYWDDWDLLHILYGGMPIFVVDPPNLAAKGPRILQTYRNVCGVLEKIGGSEMLSHRFLTPDRKVQETRFANGWRVVVNFDRQSPYQEAGMPRVPARSFAVSRK